MQTGKNRGLADAVAEAVAAGFSVAFRPCTDAGAVQVDVVRTGLVTGVVHASMLVGLRELAQSVAPDLLLREQVDRGIREVIKAEGDGQ